MRVRRPTQAGSFYAGDAKALRVEIENCFFHKFGPGRLPKIEPKGPRKIVGLVCPHAGYVYSGPVAANAYFELALDGKPDVVVVLGPNHTGYGSALALMDAGIWQTPLGDVEVDTAVAHEVVSKTPLVDVDEIAHKYEHSIEVQLPFLQYLYGDKFRLVPICFGMQDLASAEEVGRALVEVLAERNAIIIASSDFTHYESQASAAKKDGAAIKAVESMDARKFLTVVESENVTACGYGPIATLITAANGLMAKGARLLQYKTSGDITGDKSSVVGYAALSFSK